jgi:hypothetical protein
MNILLFGATGMVGDGVLRWLIAAPEVNRVVAGKYAIAIKVISDVGEPLTIMLPLEFSGAFVRLIQDAHDELQALMTAPRS